MPKYRNFIVQSDAAEFYASTTRRYLPKMILGGLSMYQNQNLSNQINQCEQMLHQLMNQTQLASQTYQQLMQQEQQNANLLEELAQREKQAVQTIEQALHGHEVAMQQMQQMVQICKQLEHAVQQNNNVQFSSTQYSPYAANQMGNYRGYQS